MKRLIVALLVGGAVFSAVFAAAATLIVFGGTLQAGSDGDLVCDEDGIYVDAWAVNTYPVLEGVEWVTIKGVDAGCNGARIMGRVTLTYSDSTDNATWAYTSGVDQYGAGNYFVIANGNTGTEYKLYLKHSDYTTPWWVPAEDIVGIKVWLEGPAND
jgi:hypothetical protein